MVKVVLDTSVIVSGLNFQKSNPAKILILLTLEEIANFTFQEIYSIKRDVFWPINFSGHEEKLKRLRFG